MSGLLSTVFQSFSRIATRSTSRRLAAVGLKFEDILISTPDVNKALERVDPEVKIEREKRMKRAFDLSLKHKYIPNQKQMSHDEVFSFYMYDKIEEAKEERQERQILNHY